MRRPVTPVGAARRSKLRRRRARGFRDPCTRRVAEASPRACSGTSRDAGRRAARRCPPPRRPTPLSRTLNSQAAWRRSGRTATRATRRSGTSARRRQGSGTHGRVGRRRPNDRQGPDLDRTAHSSSPARQRGDVGHGRPGVDRSMASVVPPRSIFCPSPSGVVGDTRPRWIDRGLRDGLCETPERHRRRVLEPRVSRAHRGSNPCSAAILSRSPGVPVMIVRAFAVTSSIGQSHHAARRRRSTCSSEKRERTGRAGFPATTA